MSVPLSGSLSFSEKVPVCCVSNVRLDRDVGSIINEPKERDRGMPVVIFVGGCERLPGLRKSHESEGNKVTRNPSGSSEG